MHDDKDMTSLMKMTEIYRASRKIFYAFDGQWNKKYEADIQNWNVNRSNKGKLSCKTFVW